MGLSPDKTHVAFSNSRNQTLVIDIPERRIESRIDTHGLYSFITNGLLMVQNGKNCGLFQINGKPVSYLSFSVGEGEGELFSVSFSPDLRHGIAITRREAWMRYRVLYLDTSRFREYVDSLGYLFHPVTGSLNDTEVRVRENANLEAPVLGKLSTGDKVDVMDRSGDKMKVGRMEDWWYKVRTAAGLEGWVYGAYLDLANPSP
jgi:hypothetical protein